MRSSAAQWDFLPSDGERVVAVRHSPFNSVVLTEDEDGMLILHFGDRGVVQSIVKPGVPTHLELAYTRVLPACVALAERLERMLVIGLGGGTLPLYFRSQFPDLVIDVAEIDREVLHLATTFCDFKEDAKLQVHIEDGRDFVERCTSRYDVILLDSFGNEAIPRHLITCEFLGAVRGALAPGGVVAANVWPRVKNPLFDDMLATYCVAFEAVYVLDVPDRSVKIFAAFPQQMEITREELLSKVRQLFQEGELKSDPARNVSTFTPASGAQGSVLRD
jgi:spermidine synthase